MKNQISKILVLTAMLSGCGAVLLGGIDSYEVVGGELGGSSGELTTTGSAAVRFRNNDAPNTQTSALYNLSFKLSDEGSIEIMLDSGPRLSGGLEIMVARTGAYYDVSIEGQAITLPLGAASNTKEVNLTLEWRKPSSRLLVWSGDRNTAPRADWDSKDNPSLRLPHSSGEFWGLQLQSAAVSRAARTAIPVVERD